MGREESLAKRTEGLQLVTFTKNQARSGGDPVGRHPVNGRIVFPDKRRLGATIKVGETYFCDLEEYQPPEGLPVYYANPVMRVDATYLFDLRSDQIAKIVDALGGTAMSPLLDQARAQIKKQIEAQFKVEFETLARERDAAKSEIDRLRTELEKQQHAAVTLKLEVENLNQRARDFEGKGKTAEPLSTPGQANRQDWLPIQSQVIGISSVYRPSSEQLTSSFFRDGHYFVHVSPDRHLLMIHPHPEGNMPAAGERLTIPGLSVLRPFDSPEDLPASIDARTGGLLVDISVKPLV
jgi:hypothetical protein